MARIPAAELERLKQEISVQRLVEARGVRLRRHGEDLVGLCPLHNDTEPSLVVSPKSNLWNCLGACGKGGSVIDWVMCAEGVSFRHAVEILREGSPMVGESSVTVIASPPKQTSVQKVESVLDVGLSDEELLLQVVQYYHQALLENDEALAYLEKRGLRDEEMIRHFRLGLANRTLGYRLPGKNRKAGAELRGRLQKLGILRKSGHEHFNGSLVIPILDSEGMVSTLYGRKIGERLRAGTPMHLYLAGAERAVWNLEVLASSKEVILCESLIDALSFWVNGFRNVTTSYGTNGFSKSHLEAFEAYGINRVLVAYDRDAAGEKAAKKHAAQLMKRGIDCYRVLFPRGMDANEYAVKVQPARQSLDLVLRKAERMGEPSIEDRHRPSSSEHKHRGEGPVLRTSEKVLSVEAAVAQGGEATKEEEQDDLGRGTMLSGIEPPALRPEDPCLEKETSGALSCPSSLAASVSSESVLPQAPKLEIPTEIRDTEIVVTLGDRRYRVRGMDKNLSYDTLKINLAAFRGEGFHVDSLDLYSARQRAAFLKSAASELALDVETVKRDLGKLLLKLEELQDAAIKEALAPKEVVVTMSKKERQRAFGLLEDPRLLERVCEDLGACGLVGEESNKLTVYLAAVSRKLERPLAVVIQSSSAAGKSALMDAVLSFVPDEERVSYSAMTGQSLYYLGEKDLSHKVLAVAEEEGAERASYALKLLQSEGELTIASTGKDPATGRLQTQEYHVEGPVALLLTTTAIDIDEELMNRCLVLSVDEGREQTEAIHALQRDRETLEGQLQARESDRLRTLHQNAQRLLEPLLVVNPYASSLRFPSGSTRTRRDHGKYLGLIRSIAFLHQHQRERKVASDGAEYIEVALEDIAWANRLAEVVLGRTLDELPPQTRRLLVLLDKWVADVMQRDCLERSQVRFTRREIRETLGWGDTQLKVHLARLVDYEYLAAYRGGLGSMGDVGGGGGGTLHAQRFVYEILVERCENSRFVLGLVDVVELSKGAGTTLNRSELEAGWSDFGEDRSGSGRPLVGGWSAPGRGEESEEGIGPNRQNGVSGPRNAHLGYQPKGLVVEASRRSGVLSDRTASTRQASTGTGTGS